MDRKKNGFFVSPKARRTVGQGQNVLRRIHHAEQRTGQEKAQQEDRNAESQTQHDRRMHRAGDMRLVPAAEIPGDENVDADGNADERADEQVDERGRRADGSERRAAVEFADDDDVSGVEQQL